MLVSWIKVVFYSKLNICLLIDIIILSLGRMVNWWEHIRKKGENVTTDPMPGAVVTVLGVSSDMNKNTQKSS